MLPFDRIPFTYLIGWSAKKMFYYGVRHGTKANPDTLWKTYFTSSKHVARFKALNGDPDIIQVRRKFFGGDDARAWEHKVLRRLGVVKRIDFLNASAAPAPPSRLGAIHSESSKNKMKRPLSAARRAKISSVIQSMKRQFQKRWLITTPLTQFCIQSLDILQENGWSSLYCSARSGKPMSRGKLKGWKLELIQGQF